MKKYLIIIFIFVFFLIILIFIKNRYTYIRNLKLVVINKQTNEPIKNITAYYGINRYEIGSNWEISKQYYVKCEKKHTDKNGEVDFGGFFLKKYKYNNKMFSHLGFKGRFLNFIDFISNGIVAERWFGSGIEDEMIYLNIEFNENEYDAKSFMEGTTLYIDHDYKLYKKSNLNYSSLAIVNTNGKFKEATTLPRHEKRFDILWNSNGLSFFNKKMIIKLKRKENQINSGEIF